MKDRRDFLLTSSKGAVGLGLSSLSRAANPAGARKGTGLVYDDRYLEHTLSLRRGQPHPESPERLRKITEALKAEGLDKALERIQPLDGPLPYIRAHHTPEHVASIREIDVTGPVAELTVAGALGAVRAVAEGRVRNAFCAIRPPGHHANNTGREEGFCFYSTAAIAAKYVQKELGHKKVLIIDWDYHHGNGTQNAFYSDPTVLFFSTHDWYGYPGTGDPSLTGQGEGSGLNINVHLDCGAKDVDMLRTWDTKLMPAVNRFQPDFVLISAGFDSRKDDLLGCFDVTDEAFKTMTRTTMSFADQYCNGRLVSLLEGGYNVDGLARAVVAHVSTLLEG
jgi:acetoin utilization deacetylase AcuC-like enzyme